MSAPFIPTVPVVPTALVDADGLKAICREFADANGNRAVDPALMAYMAWLTANDEDVRLGKEHEALAQLLGRDHPEAQAKYATYTAANERMYEALQVLDELPVATTPAGILAKFAYFTHATAGCMYMGDIRLWQSIVADIARLGLVPLERDVAAFGEGRFFGALHRLAMAERGIDPGGNGGRSITLPTSLWEPTVEQAGPVYPLPVGVAELMAAAERRIAIQNAEHAASDPEGTAALDNEARTLFPKLSAERKGIMLRWLELLVTRAHLHAATLRFAAEHGLLDAYREELDSNLASVRASSTGLEAESQDGGSAC